MSEGVNGQSLAPCKVVIQGTVQGTQAARPYLRYVFTDLLFDGEDVSLESYTIEGMEDARLEWDPGAGVWRYQAIWPQQLLRTTMVSPIEHCYVGAQVIAAPNQPGHDGAFRVVSMARPTAGAVVGNGDYTEANRPGPIETHATSAAGNTVTATATGGGAHLAVDYGGGAGATVNAAEYGTIRAGDAWRLIADNVQAIPGTTVDAICGAARQWMDQHGHNPDLWTQMLRVDATLVDGFDNSYILGPNRKVEHGQINMALVLSAQGDPDHYDRQPITSVYCHLATQADGVTPLAPPNDNTPIDISQQVAQVGSWNNEGEWLSRGYFQCTNTTLKLVVRASGEVVQQWPQVSTYWPSLNGTHLHFEVRGTVDPPDQIHTKGEHNPHNWVKLPFGGQK